MSKAEKFIQDYTRNCSNEILFPYPQIINDVRRIGGEQAKEFTPWLTPDEALRAVEIAKEEVRQEILKKAESLLVGIDANGLSCVHIEGVLPDEIVKIYVFKEE